MADISILDRFRVKTQSDKAEHLAEPQQPPSASDGPAVLDLLIETLRARSAAGELKYGTKLRAFNGRDALVDLLQELADGCMYVMQAIAERDALQGIREQDEIISMACEEARLLERERDQAREAADQWAAECKVLKADIEHLREQMRCKANDVHSYRLGCTLPEEHKGPCQLR